MRDSSRSIRSFAIFLQEDEGPDDKFPRAAISSGDGLAKEEKASLRDKLSACALAIFDSCRHQALGHIPVTLLGNQA